MTMLRHGPERLADQGIGEPQSESADRAILALLSDDEVADQVDLVIAYRRGPDTDPAAGRYEAWSQRGMVAFTRWAGDDGLEFRVEEIIAENPLANQDLRALRTVAEECAAAEASGFASADPARRFIAPAQQSYPFAYERIAQLFDSPNAPDLVVSPRDWAFGIQPGTHGALHVRQARAPLWFAGPGVAPGVHDAGARAVDIAPTVLAALGFPLIDGADASGRTSSERGVAPDVYLKRQDGAVLEQVLDSGAERPRSLYIFLLDGLHHTELEERLEEDPDALPHLRALRDRAAVLASGSIVNFPSITWPSHTAIGTGTWCGHHDVVNPSYYLRDRREMISPQGQQVETEGFSNPDVESLYEAFSRERGSGSLSAAIHAPFGRGAGHAVLERRNLCNREVLHSLNEELARDEDPRWREEGCEDAARESTLDTRGVAQVYDLFRRDDLPSPDFVYHELVLTDGVGHDYGPHSEGMRSALEESDRRIGRIMTLLAEQGRLDETLIVVTADHGMAPQQVELAANPGRHVSKAGLACEVADSMIWLLDCDLELERSADGRTARIIVHHADALPSGERPPLAGAQISVSLADDADAGADTGETIAAGASDAHGIFAFATPAEIPSAAICLDIRAPGCNRRQLTLDGGGGGKDLRAALYPGSV
jgi:hypothetical protein